jgi:hypothetical protein
MIPIKIVTLSTGERIICGFTQLNREYSDSNLNFYGVLVRCPYILKLEPLMNGEFLPDGNPKELSVNFSKWNPYTPEKQFKIPINHLLSVAEPDDQIKEIYIQKFGDDLYEWDVVENSSNNLAEESGVSDSRD